MKKKFIILGIIGILLSVFLFVYFYFYHEDSKTSLTVPEKTWIENNNTTKVNLDIPNDVKILGDSGVGVLFDFCDSFELQTGLDFNKIPYSKLSQSTGNELKFRILNNEYKLTDKDLLLLEDGYILIGRENIRYDDISQINNKTIGVIASDMAEISYFMKSSSAITYKTYNTIDEVVTGLTNNEVNMIIVPQIMYLEKTLTLENTYINYYFSEMSKKVVLTLTNNNDKLNSIVKKYFNKWKETSYVDSYNKQYLSYYISAFNLSDKAASNMINKSYVYGYVENAPYQVKLDKKAYGIAGSYVERMKRLTGMDVVYQSYKDNKSLQDAVNKGEVDFYFDDSGIANSSYTKTISPFVEKYVVISKLNNAKVINSFESLKNETVNMVNNNLLFNYIKENAMSTINVKNNINALKDDNNLIIIDKEVYDYYKNSKFKNYQVLYENYMANDYAFHIKNSNSDFYNLFNYIIGTNSYYNYRISGLNDINVSIIERTTFQELYLIVLGLVLLPILAITLIIVILKKKKATTKVKKEDRRKYTDMLTSLKNRNYLNLHMEEWENCKVYPQSIIMVDLNNIKYVNDNYGHEEGDKVIIKAASILVNTQLENSEIIRTDGNEFLLYLVGYTEKQVEIYCKKLTKEFKELPHGFGASVGYSMITDDIKTIDDAINEAGIDMRNKKEEYK